MKTLPALRHARLWALVFTLSVAPLVLVPHPARAAPSPCDDRYTVRAGDSLWGISRSCGVSIATIQRLNHLGPYLQPGQVLQLTDPFTYRSYIVQPGDTLGGIAQRLGVAPATLVATNGLANPNMLRAGQVLRWRMADVQVGAAPSSASTGSAFMTTVSVPMSYGTYQVRPGDTLWGIAQAQHISVAALAAANNIANPGLLRAGMVLRIPPATPSVGGAAQAPANAPTTTTIVSTGSYRVKPGDTLWGIAQALGLSPDELARSNGLNLATPIQPGQVLRYSVVVYRGPSREEVGAVLDQQSAQVGVEDALLKAIAWRESSWRMVDAPDGGIGVMQLIPDTVSWLQQTYVPGNWDPHDLSANIHAGAVLLLFYSHLYAGDVAKIATAYHAGMGAVGNPSPSKELQHYVNSVILFRQEFLNGVLPG